MNIALVLQHKLLLGIQRLLQGSARPLQAAPAHPRLHSTCDLPRAVVRNSSSGAAATRQQAEKIMPLRVLRVVESGMPRSSTGRLVISGRMADVCAELDRLVEREAALHKAALH